MRPRVSASTHYRNSTNNKHQGWQLSWTNHWNDQWHSPQGPTALAPTHCQALSWGELSFSLTLTTQGGQKHHPIPHPLKGEGQKSHMRLGRDCVALTLAHLI
jgi:hypothetical protein